jgi:transketolase
MNFDKNWANALRFLSIDAVQKARSGHPGMPMGMADIMAVLWLFFLKHNPNNPQWPNRDRFILSNGHGSMLHYAALHLSGYALSIEDLKQFRQLHSKTPGHPEFGVTPGVETTTGPLGQGFANAIGMAIAEKTLAAQFNQDHYPLIDHYTYVFLGDGCLMEGISHEAASLAGTLKLGKLIAFWDDNGISIDGKTAAWFSDNTPQRFEAYGWQVIPRIAGHDPIQIYQAIQQAQAAPDKPSLLCCQTQIGFGSPHLAGSHLTHGAPLGEAEIAETRRHLHWPFPPFVIPEAIYQRWDARAAGKDQEANWQSLFKTYEAAFPALAKTFKRRLQGRLPTELKPQLHTFIQQQIHKPAQAIATRQASQQVLNHIAASLPELIGGSADLTESNATAWQSCQAINTVPAGNYLHYGVRELGMVAIMNGLAQHGGFIPYGGTFLVFSDYARPAIRLAALMKLQVIFILTHDSIGLGEDGPTHQPIEQLSSLRLIPNLTVWRPCDTVETAVAWQEALAQQTGPSCLVLSRQAIPSQNPRDPLAISKGAYILKDCLETPVLILIATGSEVDLAMQAVQCSALKNQAIRVVSMPSVERFAEQSADYQASVLPPTVKKRIVIEAGVTAPWHYYAGTSGVVMGINRYGESAPGPQVYAALRLNLASLVAAASSLISATD